MSKVKGCIADSLSGEVGHFILDDGDFFLYRTDYSYHFVYYKIVKNLN
jgi:hypothetical protein